MLIQDLNHALKPASLGIQSIRHGFTLGELTSWWKMGPCVETSHELHSSVSWNKVGRGGGAFSRAWRVREGIPEGSALSLRAGAVRSSRSVRRAGRAEGTTQARPRWRAGGVRVREIFNAVQKVGFERRLRGRARASNKEFGLYPGGRGELAEDVERTVSVSVTQDKVRVWSHGPLGSVAFEVYYILILKESLLKKYLI